MIRKILLIGFLSILLLVVYFFFYFNFNSRNREINNLRTFAKLYGYVRYFHPSDEASLVDWDWFVVNGVEKVKNARSNDELQEILQELFYPVAPTIDIYKKGESPKGWQVPKDTSGLKVVFWQHYGVGLEDSKAPLYKSMRINRDENNFNDASIGRIIDAEKFQNKEVIFSCKIKSEFYNKQSFTVLSLGSYNDDDPSMEHRKYESDTIKFNGNKSYQLKTVAIPDANKLHIEVQLHGKARIIVDDIELAVIKGNINNKINIIKSDFEKYDLNSDPAIWYLNSNNYDVSISDKYPISGNHSLLIENNPKYQMGKIFDKILKPGEVIKKYIGRGLSCRIPLVLLSNNNHTIGKKDGCKFVSQDYNPKEKKSYYLNDENVRLADVIITWNIFQHFFPYFEYLTVDWNKSLTIALKNVEDDFSQQEFIKTLEYMLEPLKDGHIYVNYNDITPRYYLPFLADLVENKIVVRKSVDTFNFEPGDIITHINNIPAKTLLEENAKRISGSRQLKNFVVFNYRVFGEDNLKNSVKIMKRNLKGEEVITTKRVSGYDFWKAPDSILSPISLINSKIYYINGSKVNYNNFVDNLMNFKNSKGIIIDLREYPKSDMIRILCYLIKNPINSPNWLVPEIVYPDRMNLQFNINNWQIYPKKPYLNCRKVFLIDNCTMSYGETLSSLIKFNKLGVLLGQYTAGANGNVNSFSLPGNISVRFSGMKVTNEDGSRFYIKGVEPDVFVNKTIEAIKEGRDEYLEKAIEMIKQ